MRLKSSDLIQFVLRQTVGVNFLNSRLSADYICCALMIASKMVKTSLTNLYPERNPMTNILWAISVEIVSIVLMGYYLSAVKI